MRRVSLIVLLIFLPFCATSGLKAQATTVKVNLATHSFDAPPPYGEPILIRGAVPESVDAVALSYGEVNGSQTSLPPWIRTSIDLVPQTEFVIAVPALRPDVLYKFEFTLNGKQTRSSPLRLIILDSVSIDAAGQLHGTAVMRDTTPSNRKQVTAAVDRVTLFTSARSQAGQHFDADIGIGLGGNSGYVGLVSAAHFFPFAPINKKTDLAVLSGFWANVRQRVSIFGGLSLEEINSDVDVEPLFGVGTPIAGVGIRGFLYWQGMPPQLQPVLQHLRLNVGMIWFEQENPNPLVAEKDLKHDAFVSVTADIELKNVLGPLLALF